ncbi:MAG: hypothetical protein ACLGJC_16925 [Alphaproteobacteria bacterium]
MQSVERAAVAIGALDHAVNSHPLAPAWDLHQMLAAVSREARVDGHLVDQHRLAALIGGLRPTEVNADLRLAERLSASLALGHALALQTWHLARPNNVRTEEDTEVAAALAHLAGADRRAPVLLAAATGLREWLEADCGPRGPIRAAIPHLLHLRGLSRRPLTGLTGAAALGAIHTETRGAAWLTAFVDAITDDAIDGLERLRRLERAWSAAQAALAARCNHPGRRAVREGAAISRALDLIAAHPMIGPARLSGLLGLSVRQAGAVCEELARLNAVIELTGRRTRRLYGLVTLAPVRLNTAGPRPTGRRVRCLGDALATAEANADRPPLPPPTRRAEFEVRLKADEWAAMMDDADRVIARTRAALEPFLTASTPEVAATSARVAARLQFGTPDSDKDPVPTDAISQSLEDAA